MGWGMGPQRAGEDIMTIVRITFNPTAFSGTATVNGHSARWTLGKAGNITVASRLPLVTKAQVADAIRRAGKERMAPVQAAVKRHGYCSPEHYAALDGLRDTFDVSI